MFCNNVLEIIYRGEFKHHRPVYFHCTEYLRKEEEGKELGEGEKAESDGGMPRWVSQSLTLRQPAVVIASICSLENGRVRFDASRQAKVMTHDLSHLLLKLHYQMTQVILSIYKCVCQQTHDLTLIPDMTLVCVTSLIRVMMLILVMIGSGYNS